MGVIDSEVAVCNKALGLIGDKIITALDEDSKAGRLCTLLYGQCRDAVQRAHPWNCCISRATLPALSSTPDWGYDYEYALPTDPYCLRVLHMEDLSYEFKIERRKLLTNEDSCKILYVARIVAVAEWDKLLVDAVAARLAHELAIPITDSRTLAETRWALYESILSEARSIDAQEGTPEIFEVNTWINARL